MNTPETILSTRKLHKRLSSPDQNSKESLVILQGVELEIKSGETLAILGASGSGKSTLLGLLAGLDTADEGEIHLLGHRLDTLDEDQRADLRARHVGFIFQSFQLLPGLTALDNVLLPLELRGETQGRDRALALLQRVGLGQRIHHYPRQLSGGEQQRVAIARAFITHPGILFADEPTGNLDARTGELIIDLLMEINRELKTTLVIVTHDEQLSRRCQRRCFLENGQLRVSDD
ncbi:MAG: ABC transporter ATP-binding protein [Gammaproteobacteria bacterium]|nr:MAG: ABC transporter ATP-binding protein [Gammaproteobacteria bacterium]